MSGICFGGLRVGSARISLPVVFGEPSLAWLPEALSSISPAAVFSATANRYAVQSGSALQPASVANFFQNYSCSTKTWPIGSDGLPYEVGVDTPAYTYLTGRRGLMIDPGGTRRNDSRPQT
ncbi:MAG: hypothetical protein K5905_11995, partial [Roseibium sp.]|uniref:hypothetical protein n=1 Tax=Roseibium sp. TaxID=1936156 RepID=UPI00262A9A44